MTRNDMTSGNGMEDRMAEVAFPVRSCNFSLVTLKG